MSTTGATTDATLATNTSSRLELAQVQIEGQERSAFLPRNTPLTKIRGDHAYAPSSRQATHGRADSQPAAGRVLEGTRDLRLPAFTNKSGREEHQYVNNLHLLLVGLRQPPEPHRFRIAPEPRGAWRDVSGPAEGGARRGHMEPSHQPRPQPAQEKMAIAPRPQVVVNAKANVPQQGRHTYTRDRFREVPAAREDLDEDPLPEAKGAGERRPDTVSLSSSTQSFPWACKTGPSLWITWPSLLPFS